MYNYRDLVSYFVVTDMLPSLVFTLLFYNPVITLIPHALVYTLNRRYLMSCLPVFRWRSRSPFPPLERPDPALYGPQARLPADLPLETGDDIQSRDRPLQTGQRSVSVSFSHMTFLSRLGIAQSLFPLPDGRLSV